jgi:hypothetical protein
MPNYSKSIIYKLECKDPNINEIYIGATTDFFRRKSNHKLACINKDGKFKYNTPVYCFMRLHGGWNNWQMIQIEEVNARNKRHLNQIEAKYIKDLKAELNCVIPQDIEGGLGKKGYNKEYQSKNAEKIAEYSKEYRAKNTEKITEYNKEYYAKNVEKFAEKRKEYCANNREKIVEINKEYRAKNREKIVERNKEYHAKNREKIAEKNKVKVKCECGSDVTKKGLSRHKRSQKHQDWENLPEPNLIFVD